MNVSNKIFGILVTLAAFLMGLFAGAKGFAPWPFAVAAISVLTVTLYKPHWLAQPKHYAQKIGQRLIFRRF